MWRLKQLHSELNQPFESEDVYKIMKEGENVYLIPKKEHKFTLIWVMYSQKNLQMPGLCGKAQNYLSLFNNPSLTPVTENTKVVMLSAPLRKVTILNNQLANCWMDMRIIDENNNDLQSIFDMDQANDSRDYIRQKLQEEICLLNDCSKIFIGGMSQGCAMALYTALESHHQLGGLFGISGYLLSKVQIKNPNLRMLLMHGEKDNEIPWDFAKRSFEIIMNLPNISIISFQNAEHELKLEEIQHIKEFFQKWTN